MDVIDDMHCFLTKEYFVVPRSDGDKIVYDKYLDTNEIICSLCNVIRVKEQTFSGRKGIPGFAIPFVERRFKFEFLGNWTPILLDRECNYIKRDKLFVLPSFIEVIISSMDDGRKFSREQWEDISYWYKPRLFIKLRGDYEGMDVKQDGIGYMIMKNLDVEFQFELIDPIEAAITTVLILDSFHDVASFEPKDLLSFINSIVRMNDFPSTEDLIMDSYRLNRIYDSYPFISIKFRDNMLKNISKNIENLKHRIKILEGNYKLLSNIY